MCSHWLFKSEPYDPVYDDIDHAGFVYVIHNTIDGRKYIGKKRFHKKRTLKPLKGYKRKRIKITESDWREYTGSSEFLNTDIERLGKKYFLFEILSFHPNFTEVNYHELRLQVLLNVLEERDAAGDRIYYNRNIIRKFFPSELHLDHRIKIDEEYLKISYPQGLKNTQTT